MLLTFWGLSGRYRNLNDGIPSAIDCFKKMNTVVPGLVCCLVKHIEKLLNKELATRAYLLNYFTNALFTGYKDRDLIFKIFGVLLSENERIFPNLNLHKSVRKPGLLKGSMENLLRQNTFFKKTVSATGSYNVSFVMCVH